MDALTGETRIIWDKPTNSVNRPLDGTEDVALADEVGYLFVSSAYDTSPALSQTTTAGDGTSHVWRYYPYLEATQPEQLAYWTSSSVPPVSDRVLVFDFADIFPSSISVTYRVRGTIRDIVAGTQDSIDQTFSKTYNKTTISAFGGTPSKASYTFDFTTGDLNTPHGFQGSYASDSPARSASIQTVYRLAETVGADEHTFTTSAAFGSASVTSTRDIRRSGVSRQSHLRDTTTGTRSINRQARTPSSATRTNSRTLPREDKSGSSSLISTSSGLRANLRRRDVRQSLPHSGKGARPTSPASSLATTKGPKSGTRTSSRVSNSTTTTDRASHPTIPSGIPVRMSTSRLRSAWRETHLSRS
jgi:hypothetical protein